MARTTIPVQVLDGSDGSVIANISWTAADAGNGHSFANTGDVILLARDKGTGAQVVTVESVPDDVGRTKDKTGTIVINQQGAFGPFPVANWNQRGSGNLGLVFVDVSASTNLEFAAIRVSRS
jgi:hypothetical protein